MALRAKKPESIEKRLKALFYGKAGVGKTTAAIQFPKPYLIDTEKGAVNNQYTEILNKNGGAIFQTTDFEDMVIEIKSLLTEKHTYKTLIIDPLTIVYNDLVDKASLLGTEFGKHYGVANKKMKHLLNLLLRLDMNVIITSHSKNEYGNNLVVLGQTFDCYKKLDYLFDLVFRVEKRGNGNTVERVAYVEKSRIKSFPECEYFPFNYEEISKRYGKDILEKESLPQILANESDVKELSRLIELLKVPSETIDKWLTKAEAETLDEMSKDNITKCINFLKEQINKTEN
jgi:KaiC/GvpD/RAD55 family RecA-like ATPase